MALRTSLSRALGLEHPIVHGPMTGGPTTPQGLDLDLLAAVLEVGPMVSDVSRVKVSRLVARDFDLQTS
jgi:hypothetical protein